MRILGIILMLMWFSACGSGQSPAPENTDSSSGQNEPAPQGPETGSLPPPSFPEQGNPTFSENFSTAPTAFKSQKFISDALIQFGLSDASASDGKIARLILPGHPEYDSNDFVGPPGVQLQSNNSFSFGTFRTRIKPFPCLPSEGVVYGIFTYWNNGSDLNGNALIDNQEIDIEFLCAEANTVYLTLWTDYTDNEHFSKVTRRIDLSTGAYSQTKAGEEESWGLGQSGTLNAIPGGNLGEWFDIGFTWTANRVEFFLYRNGTRYSLWIYEDASHIPQHAAPFFFNVWHNNYHWHNDQAADFPGSAMALQVDSFSYFAP